MISVVLQILGIFACAVLLTQVFTGCSIGEAIAKVQSIFKHNENTIVPLALDEGLWSEIWGAIRNIIGDARFEKLRRIYEAIAASQGGIRLNGHHSGLPYILIILDQLTDAERNLLTAVIAGIVKRHLRERGLPDSVVVTWGEYDNGLVYLEIRFGETEEQHNIVRTVLADELRQGTQTDDKDPLFR